MRAVLLDIGGVILDFVERDLDAEWELRLNLPLGTIASRIWNSSANHDAERGTLTSADFLGFAAKTLRLDEATIAEFNEDLWSLTRLRSTTARWLEQLRRDVIVVAVTNAWTDARLELSQRYGMNALVHHLVVSAEEGCRKPEDRFYRIALERAGVRAQEALFVDDRVENVDGARGEGITAVLCQGSREMMAAVDENRTRP